MRELNTVEIDQVSGGRIMDAAPFFTAMITIGATTFGAGWGGVALGMAVVAAPVAVGTMAALSFLGGAALLEQ